MVGGVFEAGLSAGRRRGATIGSGADYDEDGLYGPRDANRQRAAEPQSAVSRAITAVARLVVPIVLLLTTFIASYLYNDTTLASLGMAVDGLTLGAVLLPTAFFASHLTNRRYGPGYAFWQIVATWLIAAALFTVARKYLGTSALPVPFATARLAWTFLAALFSAEVVGVVVFDAARGPHWWSAPLFASLWAGAVFCLIYYPAAFLGTGSAWVTEFLIHLALMAAMAVLLAIPYWLLRAIVRPLPGFGGY